MRKNCDPMDSKLIQAGFVAKDYTSTYFPRPILRGQILEQSRLKLQIIERQLLKQSDLKGIHYDFGKHSVQNSSSSERFHILCALGERGIRREAASTA
jgi:hypothetical protein